MGKKLFVGNLPYSTTDDTLKQKFAEIGPVKDLKVITDRTTGRSRGFAFVEMENDADADTAMEKMNGMDFEGRALIVREARPQQERPQRQGFSNNYNS